MTSQILHKDFRWKEKIQNDAADGIRLLARPTEGIRYALVSNEAPFYSPIIVATVS